MSKIETIVHSVNEITPALTSVRWELFQRDAILEFSNGPPDKQRILLQLSGIHFLGTRQTLLGGGILNYPEERSVHFFGIFSDSPFLQQFMMGTMWDVQHSGRIIVYDMHDRAIDELGFVRPLHVNVNCADGILDVICESVTMKREGANCSGNQAERPTRPWRCFLSFLSRPFLRLLA
ncbi:MAG: hypothetical protein ACYC6Y_12195 [Thermoguttaceae bacterium]